jgi:hypothetical protein
MVKLLAEELEWGFTLGREGLSGLPYHQKPDRSAFAEGWSFIHHIQRQHRLFCITK